MRAGAARGGCAGGQPLLLLVPLHGRLSRGPDEELARRLLRGDRTRVAVWTAASAVALALVTTAPHGPA